MIQKEQKKKSKSQFLFVISFVLVYFFIFIVETVSANLPQLENGNPNLPSLDGAVTSNNTFIFNQTNLNITNNINTFDQSLNTTDSVTFVNITSDNLLPSSNNTGSVGLEDLMWNAGFFKNFNVSNLGGLSPINVGSNLVGSGFNFTADNFFGNFNASLLENPPWVNITGDSMTGNLNMTGNDILNVEKITFVFGEIIDNLVNGWIRITGRLNVTGTSEFGGNISLKNNSIKEILSTHYSIDGCTEETFGTFCYDSTYDTMRFVTESGQILQMNQEITQQVKNLEGSNVLGGSIIYLIGATGSNNNFKLAKADNLSTSGLLGVITKDCINNQVCPAVFFAVVHGIDTTDFSVGDHLYLSETEAGNFTTTPPEFPNVPIWVATALRIHATEGTIFVFPRLDSANGITINTLGLVGDFIQTDYIIRSQEGHENLNGKNVFTIIMNGSTGEEVPHIVFQPGGEGQAGIWTRSGIVVPENLICLNNTNMTDAQCWADAGGFTWNINDFNTTNTEGADWGITGELEVVQNFDVHGNVTIGGDLNISSLTEGSILFSGLNGLISENNNNFFWNDSSQGLVLGGNEASETVGGVTKDSVITTHSQGGMNAFDLVFHRYSSQSGTFLGGFRSRGSEASESIVQDGDNLLDIFGLGYDGTDYEFASSIMFDVDGEPGDGDMPGRIVFLTTPDGSDTVLERMRISSDGNVNISNSLVVNQNLNVTNNITFNDYLFLKEDKNHWIKINSSERFDGISDDTLWLHHDEPRGTGEIVFLITHENETNAWYQSGRNNSFSGHGNSQGMIPNYWGEENFTQNGIVNMSQLSDYEFLCEFFGKDCVFTADTRGRGGPLLWTAGDLEVWRQTNLLEGIVSKGDAEFIMNGNTFDIFNGSLHIRTPRIQLVGFVFGDNVTILSTTFDGGVISPFSQTTSGGGAAEWTSVSDSSCHDDLCARSLGGTGSPIRGMSTSFSSIFLDNMNLTFFITSNMAGSDNFTVTSNNNAGSGDVLVFTTSTDIVDVQQNISLPSSMDNKSSVTLVFNFSGNNPVADSVFIDNVQVIGNATATTEANITVIDSDIEFGREDSGDGITYQGDEAIGFSVMNLTADIINVIGNTTFVNVIEVFLNVTGDAVIQGNLNVGNNVTLDSGAKFWSNSTCAFISSPNGGTVLEVCDP